MLDLLSAIIPETHQDISFGLVEVLIQERHLELFTGLMRISNPSGETLVFIFLNGEQQNLYRCTASATEIVNRRDWSKLLNRSGVTVGFLPLGVDGLRLMRVTLETQVLHTEKLNLSRGQLIDQSNQWANASEPGFIHIQSGKTHRVYVFIGKPDLIVEVLSIADGQAQFSMGDVTFAQTLPDTEYKVSRYLCNANHDVWREYKLRLAFHPLMRMLLVRFSELAGRVLAERLGGRLTEWANSEDRNISISSNGVVNRQYFDTLSEAVDVYMGILHQFQDEAGLAIGPRLVENMFRDTLSKLPLSFREIVSQYIYGQFGAGSAALIAQMEATRI